METAQVVLGVKYRFEELLEAEKKGSDAGVRFVLEELRDLLNLQHFDRAADDQVMEETLNPQSSE